jgi:hypothetical protein
MLSKITLTTIDRNNNKRYFHATSDKWRRIYSRIASAVAQKYIIKVDYGKHLDNFDKRTTFINEAECENKRDAKATLSDFLEIKPKELDQAEDESEDKA